MESKFNKSLGLPEVYLSPSKKLERINVEEANIWKNDKSNDSIDQDGETFVDIKEKCKNIYGHKNKGMRGKTSGSDYSFSLGARGNYKITSKSQYDSLSKDKSKHKSKEFKNDASLIDERSIEGARSNEELSITKPVIPYLPKYSDTLSSRRTYTTGTKTYVSSCVPPREEEEIISELVRPLALSQSEDISQTYSRSCKDLGSTDGEGSISSFNQVNDKFLMKNSIENYSLGSQSENTDSTNTVLTMKIKPIQGCEDIKIAIHQPTGKLIKPNFIVGGVISPRVVTCDKGSSIEVKQPIKSNIDSFFDYANFPSQQPDDSLNSVVSVESTHHPDSSECFTSPSVISVSSVASSKKLEWDSSADVGYRSKHFKEEPLTSSLSTLERIAIGNYASVLRTEPEGKGISSVKAKVNKKAFSNKDGKVRNLKQRENNLRSAHHNIKYNKGRSIVTSENSSVSSDEYIIKKYTKKLPRGKNENSRKKGSLVNSDLIGYSSLRDLNLQGTKQKMSSRLQRSKEEINSEKLNHKDIIRRLLEGKNNNSNVSSNSETLVANSLSSLPLAVNSIKNKHNLNEHTSSHSLDYNRKLSCSDEGIKRSYSQEFPRSTHRLNREQNLENFPLASYYKSHSSTNSLEGSEEGLELVDKNSSCEESLISMNLMLKSLSKKLQICLEKFRETGSLDRLEEYKKLQDYIDYVSIPSKNKDEHKLKESVGDVIMRMLGDTESEEKETSIYSSNSECVSSRDTKIPSKVNSVEGGEMSSEPSNKSSHSSSFEIEKMTVNNEKIKCVPYRPESATRTYYIAMSQENKEVGLMGEINSKYDDKSIECSSNGHSKDDEDTLPSEMNEPQQHGLHLVNPPYLGAPTVKKTDNFQEDINNEYLVKEANSAFEYRTSDKALYQDWHGTYHVAHQPPGYNNSDDFRQSESASENNTRRSNESSEEIRINSQVWSSSGSESAYETIRERHLNVGETLASSFEFYSTSPRDARAVGYVSDESGNQPELDTQRTEKSTLVAESKKRNSYKSSDSVDVNSWSTHHSNSCETPRKTTKRLVRKSKTQRKQNDSFSCYPESEGASSSVSVVQFQKRNYMKKIRRYIKTLEKIERTLLPSCENLLSDVGVPCTGRSAKKGHNGSDPPSSFSDRNGSITNELSSECTTTNTTTKSSDGANDESFIIHNISSSLNHQSKNLSTDSSQSLDINLPKKTSTLINKDNGTKELASKKHPDLEELGLVSNFQKLMSSNSAPGEMRPYRFLLKQKPEQILDEDKPSSQITVDSKYSIDHGANGTKSKPLEEELAKGRLDDKPISSEIDVAEQRLKNLCAKYFDDEDSSLSKNNSKSFSRTRSSILRDSKKELLDVNDYLEMDDSLLLEYLRRDSSDEKVFSNEGSKKKVANSLSSNESSIVNLDPNLDCNQRKDSSEINCFSKPSSADTFKKYNAGDESNVDGNLPGDYAMKEKKEFGQMFPSCSMIDLREKSRASICVQTGQSLLDLTSSNDQKPPAISNCCISALNEMENRIKVNTEKIEAALNFYNSKFQSTTDPTESAINEIPQNNHPMAKKLTNDADPEGCSDQQISSTRRSNLEEQNTKNYYESKDQKLSSQIRNRNRSNEVQNLEDGVIYASKNKNSLKFTVKINDGSEKSSKNKSLVEELIELNKANEIMSLQEALCLAKPRYLKEAERRRIKICKKRVLRQEIQSHNQDKLAELPDNLKTPTVLKKFMFKCEESPLFTYKTMREQNRRIYQMLPEAQKPKKVKKKIGMSKTNRLLAKYYSQKLRLKVLDGKVSHAHKEIVTPIR